MPVLAIVVTGFYGLTVMRTTGWGERLPEVPVPRIDPINLTMENPHYEGFNTNGGKYVVTADTARQDLSQIGTYKMTGIKGRITQPDASITDLWAKSGTYDNGTSVMELFERIEVAGSSGLKAHMTRATVQTKESIVKTSEPVLVEMPSGTVKARGMTLRQKSREVTFAGDVQTHLLVPAKPAPLAAPAAMPPAGQPLFGASGGPMDIASKRLDLDDNTKIAVFSGDVKAVQGDNALQSPELTVTYEGQATPTGAAAAPPSAGAPADQAGTKIKRIVAKGPILMTRGVTDQATGDALEHDGATEITVLNGNVVLTSLPDRRVTGDRAVLDSRADTALLTGTVTVLQNRNELHGRRLFVDRKTGRTQLTSPPERGVAGNRITARFFRGPEPTAAQAAAKAVVKALPETVTDAGAAAGAFKTDPSAPIDIDFDRLDVDEKAKTAIFHGDVHAVQGDFVIHTTELVAHYTGSAGLISDAQADPAATGGTQLTRIEARKKVVVTSAKSGQKAVGDWATFDVKTNLVLVGGDVLLTQGQNAVRGTQLKIDMASGESRIVTNTEGWAARTQPKGGGPGEIVMPKQGRASAVFYLPDKSKPADKPGTAAPAATATKPDAGAWQAKTEPKAKQPTKSGD